MPEEGQSLFLLVREMAANVLVSFEGQCYTQPTGSFPEGSNLYVFRDSIGDGIYWHLIMR